MLYVVCESSSIAVCKSQMLYYTSLDVCFHFLFTPLHSIITTTNKRRPPFICFTRGKYSEHWCVITAGIRAVDAQISLSTTHQYDNIWVAPLTFSPSDQLYDMITIHYLNDGWVTNYDGYATLVLCKRIYLAIRCMSVNSRLSVQCTYRYPHQPAQRASVLSA